jgi:hypothetical protein
VPSFLDSDFPGRRCGSLLMVAFFRLARAIFASAFCRSRSSMRASLRLDRLQVRKDFLIIVRLFFFPHREASFYEKFQQQGARAGPSRWASATCLEKVKLPAERVLHIDHLFARMQRLNTYEAKTNAMTRIGSNLSQVLPPPFSCE